MTIIIINNGYNFYHLFKFFLCIITFNIMTNPFNFRESDLKCHNLKGIAKTVIFTKRYVIYRMASQQGTRGIKI